MPKQPKKSSPKKLEPTIIVAFIALIGTLATAIFASPVLIALIQRTPAPPAQTSPSSSSSADSSATVDTSLTPLISVVTSGDEKCLTLYFADIDSAKLVPIEVGASYQSVYLSSEDLSKEFVGPFGIKLTQNGKMIGAFTFLLFRENSLVKLTSIVDSNCQPISEYSSTSNSGDPNAIVGVGDLLFQLAEARFDMKFYHGSDYIAFTFTQLR